MPQDSAELNELNLAEETSVSESRSDEFLTNKKSQSED
jgi:hypothetical protein